MRCQEALQNLTPILLFESDDREEIRKMVRWCRTNLGRSHGMFVSPWWIVKSSPVDIASRPRYAIAMLHGQHTFLARMIWA